APFSWGRWLRSLFIRQSRASRSPHRRLHLEHLETRVTPAVDTWTGLGGNNNWMTGGNWLSGTAPQAGDDLLFQAGPTLLSTNNNFAAGTAFNKITISGSGYTLAGNAITLGNAVSGSGNILVNNNAAGEIIALDIKLGGAAGNQQIVTV